MAPETAGPGDSLEWRSVEVAPKPQGLSARPLRRESGVPCEPATSTLNTGIFARARARAYTHMHTPSYAPTITDFCVHTRSHSQRRCTGCHVHASSHTHSSADVQCLAARFPALKSGHVKVVGLHIYLLWPELCPGTDQSGRDALGCWTNLRSCVFLSESSSSRPCLPTFSSLTSSLCLFSVYYAFF